MEFFLVIFAIVGVFLFGFLDRGWRIFILGVLAQVIFFFLVFALYGS